LAHLELFGANLIVADISRRACRFPEERENLRGRKKPNERPESIESVKDRDLSWIRARSIREIGKMSRRETHAVREQNVTADLTIPTFL